MEQTIANATVNLGITWADYAILGIIFVSIIISLLRGFVREALSLTSWIIAFWIAFKFNANLAELLSPYISTPSMRVIASFGILFIFSIFLGSLVGFLISRFIYSTGLSGTDRSLGLLFGFTRGILLAGIGLLLLSMTAFTQDDWWKHSVLIPHFNPLIVWLKGFLPGKMGELSSFTKGIT